jgi:hypothetical protein
MPPAEERTRAAQMLDVMEVLFLYTKLKLLICLFLFQIQYAAQVVSSPSKMWSGDTDRVVDSSAERAPPGDRVRRRNSVYLFN